MVDAALAFANVTVPGPLTFVHAAVTCAGGFGSPSSVTDPASDAASGRVTVRSGPAPTTGAVFVGAWVPEEYSMCRTGARLAPDSNASAVRLPEPVTISASALPPAQPGRDTISCTTDARFGVRWAAPRAPTVGHVAGTHPTAAVVRGRLETFRTAVVNPGESSPACPATVRFVAAEGVSSTWNCT